KIKIINSVLSKIQSPIHTAKFIYDIRYNKRVKYGFEQLWQKATHLITSQVPLQTEENNLNFVFSDKEAIISQ
ncbi:MAG: hypothetical protein DRP06_02775, partial [Candidatus Aenigmatarchaeota archaeon]